MAQGVFQVLLSLFRVRSFVHVLHEYEFTDYKYCCAKLTIVVPPAVFDLRVFCSALNRSYELDSDSRL